MGYKLAGFDVIGCNEIDNVLTQQCGGLLSRQLAAASDYPLALRNAISASICAIAS